MFYNVKLLILTLLTIVYAVFCSDQRLPGLHREYQQARAAPGYEELDAARRRVLDHDPQRVSVRARSCAVMNKKEGM